MKGSHQVEHENWQVEWTMGTLKCYTGQVTLPLGPYIHAQTASHMPQ